MQNTRHTQYKLRNLDIELRAVVGMHPIAAAHRADLCGQHRAAGVFKTLVRFKQWVLFRSSLSAHLLNMVVGIGDDPVTAGESGGDAAEIGDVDGVGKHEAIARFIGLIRQVIYLCFYDETMWVIFFHARHLNRFSSGSQDRISGTPEISLLRDDKPQKRIFRVPRYS